MGWGRLLLWYDHKYPLQVGTTMKWAFAYNGIGEELSFHNVALYIVSFFGQGKKPIHLLCTTASVYVYNKCT